MPVLWKRELESPEWDSKTGYRWKMTQDKYGPRSPWAYSPNVLYVLVQVHQHTAPQHPLQQTFYVPCYTEFPSYFPHSFQNNADVYLPVSLNLSTEYSWSINLDTTMIQKQNTALWSTKTKAETSRIATLIMNAHILIHFWSSIHSDP